VNFAAPLMAMIDKDDQPEADDHEDSGTEGVALFGHGSITSSQ